MEEITGPIVAITLVLCSVFLPSTLVPGLTGQFYRQFAIVISVSMIISAINAMTLTPSRAVAIFRRDEGGGMRDEGRGMREESGNTPSHPSSLIPHPSREAL